MMEDAPGFPSCPGFRQTADRIGDLFRGQTAVAHHEGRGPGRDCMAVRRKPAQRQSCRRSAIEQLTLGQAGQGQQKVDPAVERSLLARGQTVRYVPMDEAGMDADALAASGA